MESHVTALGAAPDPNPSQTLAPQRPDAAQADPAAPASDPGDLRLVIEQDKATGTYIYKTVNRSTGEVVLQLPRDQILKMQQQVEYVAGTIVRATA